MADRSLVAALIPTMIRAVNAPPADDDSIRSGARDVFRRAEFHREPGLVSRVLNWLAEHLDFQTDATPGGGAWGGPLGAIILWIVLILLVVGLAWIIASVVRGRVRRKRTAVDEATIEIEEHRSVSEWQAEAERHEAEGNWKDALRCRLRELVGTLVASGHVQPLPGRTTGELRSDLRTTVPSAAAEFDRATLLFDLAWYADRATGPDQNREFRALAASVIAASTTRAMTRDEADRVEVMS